MSTLSLTLGSMLLIGKSHAAQNDAEALNFVVASLQTYSGERRKRLSCSEDQHREYIQYVEYRSKVVVQKVPSPSEYAEKLWSCLFRLFKTKNIEIQKSNTDEKSADVYENMGFVIKEHAKYKFIKMYFSEPSEANEKRLALRKKWGMKRFLLSCFNLPYWYYAGLDKKYGQEAFYVKRSPEEDVTQEWWRMLLLNIERDVSDKMLYPGEISDYIVRVDLFLPHEIIAGCKNMYTNPPEVVVNHKKMGFGIPSHGGVLEKDGRYCGVGLDGRLDKLLKKNCPRRRRMLSNSEVLACLESFKKGRRSISRRCQR